MLPIFSAFCAQSIQNASHFNPNLYKTYIRQIKQLIFLVKMDIRALKNLSDAALAKTSASNIIMRKRLPSALQTTKKEIIGLIGPSGTGKTTAMLELAITVGD